MLYKMFEVLFDPRKPTDIRKTSAMDFAVRRTGKPNKISFGKPGKLNKISFGRGKMITLS